MPLMPPLFANRWLTALPPIWLVGAGALASLLVAAAVYGLLTVIRQRAAAELRVALRDGFLGPLGWLLVVYAAVAVAFTPLVPVGQMVRSLARMTAANDASLSVQVPGGGSRSRSRSTCGPRSCSRSNSSPMHRCS